jgi:membrane fusion protein (multidrug efflux system)
MTPRTKGLLFSIIGLVLVVGALGGTKALQIGSMIEAGSKFTIPPETVSSAKAERAEWQPALRSVGTIVAVHAVTLASEVPGKVRRIGFESGATVRPGQLLVELDDSIEKAQLAAADAEAALAQINLERAASLRALKTVTQADLELADTRAKQTRANVDNIRATIAKKSIRAPFEGRLGMRSVEIGQVLSPGTPIATLTDFDPIYVDFFLPQQALAQLSVDQVVKIDTDAFEGESWEGRITAINSEVDVASRNVKVRAQFQNTGERLRPGMFVNVQVLLPQMKDVLIVSATAIIHAPYGDSVFVIEEAKDPAGKANLVVRQKFVRTGERRGDLAAIESGLDTGETVVSAGAFKLKNGMSVVINNDLAPDPKLSPNPSDT